MLGRIWLSGLAAASVASEGSLASLVEQGRLAEADRALVAQPWRAQPLDTRLAACRLLLLQNKAGEAQACLEGLPSAGPEVSALLAQAFVRQGAWGKAATAFAAAGRDSAANRAGTSPEAPRIRTCRAARG